MGRKAKRTRLVARKQSPGITIREIIRSKDGYEWTTYLVQGWRNENGKWGRKQFKNRIDAEAFAAVKSVSEINKETSMRPVTTRLTSDQVKEAEAAYNRLGDRYTLPQAIDFFLGHYCEPDFKIELREAAHQFIVAKEGEGIRERSRRQLRYTLGQLERFMENCPLHEITDADLGRFLKSLRARDNINPIGPQTWHNRRMELHGFFAWCADMQRRWIPINPVGSVPRKNKGGRDVPGILTASETLRLMSVLARWRDGALVPYFAIAIFAGIRPEELQRLATKPKGREGLDLKHLVIHIRPDVSKVRQYRQVAIRANLTTWLKAFPGPILPDDFDTLVRVPRKHFKLGHDVLRHTFLSMHVARWKSIGEAALEAGNSEAVVRKHYLNLSSLQEAREFWRILPRTDKRGAIIGTEHPTNILKVA